MRDRFLMVNPVNLKSKIITTWFGSPYFIKQLREGYICCGEVMGWDVTLKPLAKHLVEDYKALETSVK